MTTKRMLKRLTFLVLLFSATALHAAAPQSRPETWAQPIETTSLKNFYKLDDHVYRSAQPKKEGFAYLTTLGIKNILNLRDYHNDDPGSKKQELNLHRIEMDAGKLRTADVVAAGHRFPAGSIQAR